MQVPSEECYSYIAVEIWWHWADLTRHKIFKRHNYLTWSQIYVYLTCYQQNAVDYPRNWILYCQITKEDAIFLRISNVATIKKGMTFCVLSLVFSSMEEQNRYQKFGSTRWNEKIYVYNKVNENICGTILHMLERIILCEPCGDKSANRILIQYFHA